MEFQNKLIKGTLIRRYKRFLSDVKLESGEVVVAHCTNSGSMKTCIEEGAEVYLSPALDPKRKTKFTWEMIKIDGLWIGINTSIPNLIAFEAIKNQEIPELIGYTEHKREVKFGDSRFDIFASNQQEKCFVEVKNVSMKDGDFARFPDAVTSRGLKHLNTLMEVKKQNLRAVMLYIIQRQDISKFGPAYQIDKAYAEAMVKAKNNGVELLAYMADVSPKGIEISKRIPIEFQNQ